MEKKYEVVISGVAGRFPESENCEELFQNLLDKKDLITNDDRRWVKAPPFEDIPNDLGKIKERDTMDMTFFGFHRRLCEVTDPNQRICIELAFSAVLDAGINPQDLWGTNTAVITNSVTSETEYECLMDVMNIGLALLGHSRSMQANRISYTMNLTGPSLMVDSSWNGGAEGLAYAADLIERGAVRAAIVASCSIIYTAEVAYHYYRMGRLTHGRTRCFSDDADGYNRSEGSVAFFLQRKDDALRSYGSPLTTSVSFKGSKEIAFSEMSKEALRWYLETFYSTAKIDPGIVSYVEAAGVASKVVDAAELNALGEVMATRRKKPLLVGCAKSNLGHTEASSSSVAIAKATLISNFGIIPPNINYNKPNSLVPYLSSGEIQIVTEPTPLEGDYIAVNNISATSGFTHCVIKRHDKVKNRILEKNVLPPDGLPRLLLISGRDQDRLNEVLKKIEERPIDEEYVALVNNVFKRGIKKHLYRGYTVLNDKEKSCVETKAFFTGGQERLPVWWVFTGMGSQWPGMGLELMKLPVFAKAINKCHEILKPKGVDLINIITTKDGQIYDNILHSFVGIAAIQIGLVDVLREAGLEPDGIVGHSVGELGCAYADGCFTAEQMILAAYARGKASIETELIQGMMAAVGLGYKNIKNDLPEGIEVACHNSSDSCTLSGPAQLMEEYISKIKEKGIFAKLVNVANIAYHSKYIKPAAPALLKYLQEVIPEPKLRSSKWISSSVPEADWSCESAKYSSAEYHTNNLLGSVLFEEATVHIPKKAVIVEIAPHGLLQAILKRSFPNSIHIPLTSRAEPNGLIFLFTALGRLYLEGVSLEIEKLYPPVEFPVSRGTPSLNDLVVWDHSELWRIKTPSSTPQKFVGQQKSKTTLIDIKPRYMQISSNLRQFYYLKEHTIYDQATIPLSFYLVNVIQDYQMMRQSTTETLKIKNIVMNKSLELTEESISLFLTIGKGTGSWEVCCNLDAVASGEIDFLVFGLKEFGKPSLGTQFPGELIYSYFKHIGHDLGPSFRLIKSVTISDTEISAFVEWNGDLVCFLDAILKLPALLLSDKNQLKLINSLLHLTIDFSKFDKSDKKDVLFYYNSVTGILLADGVEALYPKSINFPEISDHREKMYLCGDFQFVPYAATNIASLNELLELTVDILSKNIYDLGSSNISLSVFEIREDLDLHDLLHSVLKWKNDIQIHMKVASTDSSLGGYVCDSKSEYCFILTGSCELENSISVLKSARGGFMLIKGHQTPPTLATIFSVIIDNERYTLCCTRKPLKKNPSLILMNSKDWKTQLKMALVNSNNNETYLFGCEASLPVINHTIQECSQFVNSHLLRFIFIDSDPNEFDILNCKDQLEKDLRVNILQDEKWGLYSTKIIDLEVEHTVSLKPVYKLSDFRCDGSVTPKAVSLNLTDLSNAIEKLEIFEYSGLCCFDDVCGIARLDEKSHTLCIDPVFQWNKPKGWSHEEVCSVLIPYALAFFILNYDETRIFLGSLQKRVLVHQGLLPFSQAFIRVALHYGKEVYTSYKSQEEKERILELFPELPEDNLVNSETQQYDVQLLKQTEGKGIDIIVNTLPEVESLKTTVRSMAYHGMIFQVSLPIIEEDEKLGLMLFLSQVSVQGINPSSLLYLHDDIKKKLHSLIYDGFTSGLIKPLSFLTLPSGSSNIDALSTIRKFDNRDKKIVVQMNEKSPIYDGTLYCSDINGCSIVLGDDGGFWVDLLEWLVLRGTNCIYVVTTKNMLSGMAVEKLRRLQHQNSHINLFFSSETRVRNLEAIEMFIGGIRRIAKLDTVFIIGEAFEYTVEDINNVLINEKLVMMGEKSSYLCEYRIKQGLPTLAINLAPHLMSPYVLIPRLDKLLRLNYPRITLTEMEINHEIGIDTERTAFTQHLPASVNEILDLARCPKEAEWREVRSCCPYSSSCFELPPVFVILPIKKGQLDKILQNLFHPTYVAVAPEYFKDFEDLAKQLHKGLQKFNTGVFTIICSDWSWIVGLFIGKLLEADGKIVSLIFFECPITWDSPAAFYQVQSLVRKDLSQSSFNDIQKEKLGKKIEIAINTLKHRLSLFSHQLPEVKQKIKGICHYLRPNVAYKAGRISKIQEHCERPINVFTTDDFDFLRMMGDRKLINLINTSILFEYKDSAQKIEKVLLKNAIFKNTRLSFMTLMQSLHDSKIQVHLVPKVEHTPL